MLDKNKVFEFSVFQCLHELLAGICKKCILYIYVCVCMYIYLSWTHSQYTQWVGDIQGNKHITRDNSLKKKMTVKLHIQHSY